MRLGEISSTGESCIPMAGSGFSPRERLLLTLILAAIMIWGFTGWEYPEIEGVSQGAKLMTAGRGAELFQSNGCYACHSLEGETIIGPTLLGIFGTTVELEDGRSVLIDDAYLVESILQPEAKRVAGYGEAAMPSYEGLVSATDAEALAEYIKHIR